MATCIDENKRLLDFCEVRVASLLQTKESETNRFKGLQLVIAGLDEEIAAADRERESIRVHSADAETCT